MNLKKGQRCWLITVEMPLDFDPHLPALQVDELHIQKSPTANGYDVEVVALGKHISNLRVASITIENILMAVQVATRAAWGAQKHEIPVANFDMTVTRGEAAK